MLKVENFLVQQSDRRVLRGISSEQFPALFNQGAQFRIRNLSIPVGLLDCRLSHRPAFPQLTFQPCDPSCECVEIPRLPCRNAAPELAKHDDAPKVHAGAAPT